MIYPVITLYQPWATWIMRRWKLIETRTHARFDCLKDKTILIHSGMTVDGSDAVIRNPYLTREEICHNPDEVVSGFILGSVNVYRTAWLDYTDSKAALIDCSGKNRFGLFLKNAQPLDEPIKEIGSMGIWYYDLENKRKSTKKEYDAQFQNSLFN